MKTNPIEYAATLKKNQGKENALDIAEKTLKSCVATNTVYFDEAEWSVNSNANFPFYEMAKSNRLAGRKEKREKQTLAFWQNVVSILKKENK